MIALLGVLPPMLALGVLVVAVFPRPVLIALLGWGMGWWFVFVVLYSSYRLWRS